MALVFAAAVCSVSAGAAGLCDFLRCLADGLRTRPPVATGLAAPERRATPLERRAELSGQGTRMAPGLGALLSHGRPCQ